MVATCTSATSVRTTRTRAATMVRDGRSFLVLLLIVAVHGGVALAFQTQPPLSSSSSSSLSARASRARTRPAWTSHQRRTSSTSFSSFFSVSTSTTHRSSSSSSNNMLPFSSSCFNKSASRTTRTRLSLKQSSSPSAAEAEAEAEAEVDPLQQKQEQKPSVLQVSLTTNEDEAIQDDDGILVASPLKFRWALNELVVSVVLGCLTGFSVAIFKLSIEAMRRASYSLPFLATTPEFTALIPAFGGLMVGLIALIGTAMPPGLRGQVAEVEEESEGPPITLRERLSIQFNSWKKSAASVFTLGTGCSLGPEGPCVEIGMGVARSCMDINRQYQTQAKITEWNRILLSCGAAAGVAAGFDAPVAGVFFALEVMQSAFQGVNEENRQKGKSIFSSDGLFTQTSTITPVLLSSVLSALCARSLLGQHLVFQLPETFSLPNPLIELPMYMLLGFVSGCVAFLFSQAAKFSQNFFSGSVGSSGFRKIMKTLPPLVKPLLGGLFCGVVGLVFPQILFFGYETLNTIMANKFMPTSLLLSLLFVKSISTAVSAGSGLVGGTFAPALFLGAMTGASFHNIMNSLYLGAAGLLAAVGLDNILGPTLLLADLPCYAMVGAASVLAALFRAPLTASLLLFELSRDYDVILPLIVSAGIGSVVGDLLEDKFEQVKSRRRDQDSASWGDLSTKIVERMVSGETTEEDRVQPQSK